MQGTPAMPSRRLVLLLPLAAIGCSRREPVTGPVGRLDYTALLPLRLNVATISISDAAPPVPTGDVGLLLQVPPPDAVRLMARQRLSGVGTAGEALFGVTAASLVQANGNLVCRLGCRLDIINGQGLRQGFIEAETSATMTLSDRAVRETRARVGEVLLRRAMDQLNVEFEFQIRRSLRDWLVEAAPGAQGALPTQAVAPVQQEVLPADPATPSALGTPAPVTAPVAAPALAPPVPPPAPPPAVLPPPGGGFLQLPR